MDLTARDDERFYAKVCKSEDCWEWTGAKLPKGYGIFTVITDGKQRHIYSHRYAFERYVRPLLPGEQIHHQCRNKGCCNPSHLTATTANEHKTTYHMGTTCRRGHVYTLDGKGRRICTVCKTERIRKRRAEGESEPVIVDGFIRFDRGLTVPRKPGLFVKSRGDGYWYLSPDLHASLSSEYVDMYFNPHTGQIGIAASDGSGGSAMKITTNGRSRRISVRRFLQRFSIDCPQGLISVNPLNEAGMFVLICDQPPTV